MTVRGQMEACTQLTSTTRHRLTMALGVEPRHENREYRITGMHMLKTNNSEKTENAHTYDSALWKVYL